MLTSGIWKMYLRHNDVACDMQYRKKIHGNLSCTMSLQAVQSAPPSVMTHATLAGPTILVLAMLGLVSIIILLILLHKINLIALINSCAMNVDSTVPTSSSLSLQSLRWQSIAPRPCSWHRKLINFVPKIVAPSPVIARPKPVLPLKKRNCSLRKVLYIFSKIGPSSFLRSGPLYLICKQTKINMRTITMQKTKVTTNITRF